MKKNFLLTLLGITISIILILIVIPSSKVREFKIKMCYYINQTEFNTIKNDLLKEQYDVLVKKNDKNLYELTINNEKRIMNLDELKKKYKSIVPFIEKYNVIYIHKEGENIIINFNSGIGFAQNIVYLKNYNDFKFSHEINKKLKLKNLWYYIEED